MIDKTHKIVYWWCKNPFIIDKTQKISRRIQLRSLNLVQSQVFNAITSTMFAAHGIKMNKEDRTKLEFEIFTQGSQEECQEMLKKFHNLHLLDFGPALSKIKNKFRKKAQSYAEQTKFEKMQEQLEGIGINFEVRVDEL